MIGVILMIVGIVGFVISIVFWPSWRGFGGSHASRRRSVYRQEPGETSVEERQQSVPRGAGGQVSKDCGRSTHRHTRRAQGAWLAVDDAAPRHVNSAKPTGGG
jgi:hypothetical protein